VVYEDLSDFDLLYVSGGLGTVALMDNKRAIDYLRSWGPERPLASVCSGAPLLGRAGYLHDERAATHHMTVDLLRPHCREVVTSRRVVDEDRIVTSGGVSCRSTSVSVSSRNTGAPTRGSGSPTRWSTAATRRPELARAPSRFSASPHPRRTS
jgi:putative intracellular protease/amidase